MIIDRTIDILVTITLIEMMVAVGLDVTSADLLEIAKDWRLQARAALANYVCVPAATVGLLLLFHTAPMVAAGFLILAVCPGAPFVPPLAGAARGNTVVAVGLMAILAASSAIIAPLLLQYLLPMLSASDALTLDGAKIVKTLVVTQLIPLAAGLVVRHWRPVLAQRLQKPANFVSALLTLVTVTLIVAVQFPMLMEIRSRGVIGMFTLLIASWGAGWLLGGTRSDVRRTIVLTTSLRNIGVGLVIASSAFPDTPAVTATVAYGLFGVTGSVLLAVWWRRHPEPGAGRARIERNPPAEQPGRQRELV